MAHEQPQQSVVSSETESVSADAHEAADARQLFRDHGLRCTRQRELIYQALMSTTAHPTADELHHMVRELDPGLSLATVYNALEVFTDRGLCQRLPASTASGPARYDADVDDHVHVRLSDGRVMDLSEALSRELLGCIPRELLERISLDLGVRVETVSVELRGR